MPYTGPTILQSDTDVITGGTSGSVALTGVVEGSRLVAIETSSSSTAAALSTITDTQGNTWTKQVTQTHNGRTTAIWTATAGAAGANTVTGTFSAADNWVLEVFELTAATIAGTDSDLQTVNSSTLYSAASPGVTYAANCLIIAAASATADVTSWTAGTGFTLSCNCATATHAVASQTGQFEAAPTDERAPFSLTTPRAGSAALIGLVSPASGSSTYTGFQGRKGLQRTGFRQR